MDFRIKKVVCLHNLSTNTELNTVTVVDETFREVQAEG